ncbi:MAG: ABC transporter permease [Candidatus Diapherotrites archaeon]|nr:ABC transporter permease [Candidatus Diapherotrites archaeon]
MDFETLSVAFRNLRREGVRTYLTLIGVIIGIAAIAALLSIGQGLNFAIEEQFQQLGTNTIFITPGGLSPGTSSARSAAVASRTSSVLHDADLRAIESFSEVDEVIPLFSFSSLVKHAAETVNSSILAFDPVKAESLLATGFIEINEGRSFVENDVFTVLVGKDLAENGFLREIKPHTSIEINGKRFRVIGTLKQGAQSIGGGPNISNTLILTEKGFKQAFGSSQSPLFVMVKTFDQDSTLSAKEKIDRYFERQFGEKVFTVTTSEQVLEQVTQVLGLISLFLVGIAAISLVVGSLGIMNAMVTNVLERTTEIGVMKAIGATNSRILSLFLTEAALIGLIGGIIGLILGFSASQLVAILGQSAGFNLKAILDIPTILFILGFSMFIGMISGYYPALRASRMDPVDALRRE